MSWKNVYKRLKMEKLTVKEEEVLRGIDPILDEEAVRVVSQSPKWTPGFIKGEPVRVTYNFPVVFQLSKKK